MSELRRLKTLLPPELQSWVMVEGTTEVNPPLMPHGRNWQRRGGNSNRFSEVGAASA
jgi:hypothetical protein